MSAAATPQPHQTPPTPAQPSSTPSQQIMPQQQQSPGAAGAQPIPITLAPAVAPHQQLMAAPPQHQSVQYQGMDVTVNQTAPAIAPAPMAVTPAGQPLGQQGMYQQAIQQHPAVGNVASMSQLIQQGVGTPIQSMPTQVQVIQPSVNQAYLQHMYNAQGPLIMGNVVHQPGTIQLIAPGKPINTSHMISGVKTTVIQPGQGFPTAAGYTTAIPTSGNAAGGTLVMLSQNSLLAPQSKQNDLVKIQTGQRIPLHKQQQQQQQQQSQLVASSSPGSIQQQQQTQLVTSLANTGSQQQQQQQQQHLQMLTGSPQLLSPIQTFGHMPQGTWSAVPQAFYIRPASGAGTHAPGQPGQETGVFIQSSPQHQQPQPTISQIPGENGNGQLRFSAPNIAQTIQPQQHQQHQHQHQQHQLQTQQQLQPQPQPQPQQQQQAQQPQQQQFQTVTPVTAKPANIQPKLPTQRPLLLPNMPPVANTGLVQQLTGAAATQQQQQQQQHHQNQQQQAIQQHLMQQQQHLQHQQRSSTVSNGAIVPPASSATPISVPHASTPRHANAAKSRSKPSLQARAMPVTGLGAAARLAAPLRPSLSPSAGLATAGDRPATPVSVATAVTMATHSAAVKPRASPKPKSPKSAAASSGAPALRQTPLSSVRCAAPVTAAASAATLNTSLSASLRLNGGSVMVSAGCGGGGGVTTTVSSQANDTPSLPVVSSAPSPLTTATAVTTSCQTYRSVSAPVTVTTTQSADVASGASNGHAGDGAQSTAQAVTASQTVTRTSAAQDQTKPNTTVTSSLPEGKNKLAVPKAMVKPHVLTHVIDGFFIQEASEPFTVGKGPLFDSKSSGKENNPEPTSDTKKSSSTVVSVESGLSSPGSGDLSKKKHKRDKNQVSQHDTKTASVTGSGNKSSSQSPSESITATTLQQKPSDPASDSPPAAKRARFTDPVAVPALPPTTASTGTPAVNGGSAGGAPSGDNGKHSVASSDDDIIPDNSDKPNPATWNVGDVAEFIRQLPGCSDYAEDFALQEIDGQALLLLRADHLMQAMSIRLGPALKICAKIDSMRAACQSPPSQ